MKRPLIVALVLVAATLAGCATFRETNTNASSAEGLASPTTSPQPLAGNVFFPSPGPHYHGSMGP